MKLVFRTDASFQIGTGHVMRCLTIAKVLRDCYLECTFVCREHDGNLIEKIRQEGFTCIALAVSNEAKEIHDADEPVIACADWLGASWQNDAKETIHALCAERVDWLVVDHYALDRRWEEALRPYAKRIMVIDDLADRHHNCDLLLDQNLIVNFETRYQNLLPEHCAALLGPQYALLQPEYAELSPRTPPRTGPVKRVLVFFGGADHDNLTGRTVSAFLKLKRHDILVDVVLSSYSSRVAEIYTQAQHHDNIIYHYALPTLAPLVLQADLGIGAAGATSWERCCLGLPSLVITLAENQKPVAAELHQRGLVRWLGHFDSVADDLLFDAFQAAIEDRGLEGWSRACMSITDGGGVKRVASVIMLNSETKLNARLALLADEALLLRWANDPLVRANSFNPEVIDAETHQKWFHKRLRDPKQSKIYILQNKEAFPIGQVRFERHENDWEIHYSLAPFARGHGLARNLLRTAMNLFLTGNNGAQVFGRVKQGNLASQKVFEELGFARSQGGGEIIYSYIQQCKELN